MTCVQWCGQHACRCQQSRCPDQCWHATCLGATEPRALNLMCACSKQVYERLVVLGCVACVSLLCHSKQTCTAAGELCQPATGARCCRCSDLWLRSACCGTPDLGTCRICSLCHANLHEQLLPHSALLAAADICSCAGCACQLATCGRHSRYQICGCTVPAVQRRGCGPRVLGAC